MVSVAHTWHVHAGEEICQKQPITLPPSGSQVLLHHPMAPSTSASATARRSPRGTRASVVARRRRDRNAAAVRTPLVGSSATARGLAAGLWRLRHAERQAVGTAARRRHVSPSRRRRKENNCDCNKMRSDLGVQSQCRNHGFLEKIEACVEIPYGSMEKATKWDHVYLNHMDKIFGSHDPYKLPHVHCGRGRPYATVLLEAELEKARARIYELEDDKRAMRKKLERFLRKLAEEKALWKSRMREKAHYVIAALKEDVKMERKHRRQLEAANTKLMDELAQAKLSAKQCAQSYEMERKARELMEEACDELTKEVEEDQAEVELLRKECLSMREEIEEERKMLQMAEVWREERVQMKLSDAKIALQQKYAQINRLQAEMESFLRKDGKSDANNSTLREARMISAAASSVRFRNLKELSHQNAYAPQEVEMVFEHFSRKQSTDERHSPTSPESNINSVSPATDIFLEKLDDTYANGSADLENDSGWRTPRLNRRRDSFTSVGTSDPSVARASNASLSNGKSWGGSGLTDVHPDASRPSGKNAALIRRLWRSAISESRKITGSSRSGTQANGWTPSSDKRSTVITPTLPFVEQCSSSDSVKPQRIRESKGRDGLLRVVAHKQSLKEKLLEARMDDQKEKPSQSGTKDVAANPEQTESVRIMR